MKEKAPGKTLLQVVGIILVVIGVLALLVSLINIAVLGMTGSGEVGEIMEQSLATTGVTMADYKASVYIMTAGALINLVIGIIGDRELQQDPESGDLLCLRHYLNCMAAWNRRLFRSYFGDYRNGHY